MSAVVTRQGLLDTIQDAGRFGLQHLGINTNGSMDNVAAAIANVLVGNRRDEPVIELHFPAPSIMFQQDCLIAVSGADFYPLLNDMPILINIPVMASKLSVLKFERLIKGARSYLAVHGGWEADLWLNSHSTNLKAGAGGYHGRALKKGDVINIKQTSSLYSIRRTAPKVKVEVPALYSETDLIRCVTGNEYDWLSDDAKNKLQSGQFQISSQSDRMGYRLQGEALQKEKDLDSLSSAVTAGTIQLLPSGQLIILMADHQTSGGYPKIGHVISADLPKLAQMLPNQTIQFKLIPHAEAEEEFMKQQRDLERFEDAVRLQLQQFIQK